MPKNQTGITAQFLDRRYWSFRQTGLARTAGRLFSLMALEAWPFGFSDLEIRLRELADFYQDSARVYQVPTGNMAKDQ